MIADLVNHRYNKEMQAIHQVMSLGNLQIIEILVKQMGADINSKMFN